MSLFSSSPSFQLPESSIEDVTRQRAEYEQAAKHGHETRDALIRLIWTQVHSRDRNQMRLGVKAADQLLTLKAEESQQLLYLAAVGEYKLGKLTEARTRLKAALQGNKDFSQGKNLLKAIDDKLTSDTIVAGGVVAAVVGVSVTLAGVLLAGGSGKRR